MKKLKIAIDFDDVLAKCTAYACELAAKDGCPINYEEITQWGKTGKDTDIIFKYFQMEDFYRTQPVYDGAKDFVKTLISMGHEVLILTAVDPRYASIRAHRIMSEFPEIKPENIILSSRKDLVQVDVLIDDAAHNIAKTPAKYPILMRRPWNESLTGLISVYNYEDIISFINRISELDRDKDTGPKVYALVGPSGSGKTAIAQELIKDPRYEVAKSTTTRKRREGEAEDAYNFISKETFEELYASGHFIETTVYAGNRYGTTKEAIEKIISRGVSAVIPLDICGANALKTLYGEQCVTVFVKRPKSELIKAMLERMAKNLAANPQNRDAIISDIQNRLLSLNSERKNEEICDRILQNNGTIDEAIRQVF